MAPSGVSSPDAASGFFVKAAFDFGFGGALDMAAALAALTLSAAAVGFTAEVEFAARVAVAEDVVLLRLHLRITLHPGASGKVQLQ